MVSMIMCGAQDDPGRRRFKSHARVAPDWYSFRFSAPRGCDYLIEGKNSRSPRFILREAYPMMRYAPPSHLSGDCLGELVLCRLWRLRNRPSLISKNLPRRRKSGSRQCHTRSNRSGSRVFKPLAIFSTFTIDTFRTPRSIPL
jgi:hypothetical protein